MARLQNGKAQQPGREGAYRAGADGVYGVQPADAVRHPVSGSRSTARFALPLVLCFVLLEQRRYLPAAVLYGVALAIKPQALLFGPVLAVCYLAAITLEKDRLRAFGRCFGGAALVLLPPLLTGLPFFWRCAVDPEADRQIHRHNVRLPLRDDQRL